MWEQLLTAGPLALGGLTLAGFGWNRAMRRRRKKDFDAALAERLVMVQGSYALRHEREVWVRTKGKGQLVLLVVGGYATRNLPYILKSFVRGGTADQVGIILIVEADLGDLALCLDSIPPEFRDRVVVAQLPLIPGGGLGETIAEVQAKSHLWSGDLNDAVRQWLARIEHDTKPVLLIAILSTGGMVALGLPPLEAFHQRYSDAPIYLITTLDHKSLVQSRFPDVRQHFMSNGMVRGGIVTHNGRFHTDSDLSVSLLPATMAGSNWVGALPLAPWNAPSYLFPKTEKGKLATLSTWAEMLPVHHLEAWEETIPELFYTPASQFEEKVLRGITAVMEQPELQAIPLEAASKSRTRLIYVSTPLRPDPDLRLAEQRIMANLKQWKEEHHPELLINFASLGAPMSQDTKQIPLVITLLQPLANDGSQLDALATGKHTIAEKFLPKSARRSEPAQTAELEERAADASDGQGAA